VACFVPICRRYFKYLGGIQLRQIGIIGTGSRALAFVDNIRRYDNYHLAGICDVDLPRTEVFMRLTQVQTEAFANHQDLLKDPNLDAVIITTPDYNHSSIMLDSLQYGKHVLCEKPIAITLYEANQLLQTLERHQNQVCLVALVLRYHPLYQELINAIPHVGNIKLIMVTDYMPGGHYFRRWHRWREKSGGLLLHEGIHSLDIVQSIVNKKVRRVSATAKLQFYQPKAAAGERCSACQLSSTCTEYFDLLADPLRELYDTPTQQEGYPRDLCVYNSGKDTPDVVVAHIEYEDGPLLVYTLCMFTPLRTRELKFVGDMGLLSCDEASKRLFFEPHRGGQPFERVLTLPEGRYGGADLRLFRDFVQLIESGKPDHEGLIGAIDSTILALALEASMLTRVDIRISRSIDGTYIFS
jgi:predicted dehydrogenase